MSRVSVTLEAGGGREEIDQQQQQQTVITLRGCLLNDDFYV